eukprot:CAMPEP_0174753216 /NCGR_PEP_ID=MMETSP1094-20130205/103607_1 /TAXON_ID=156173 /ORGANISM="Chrysochromulina brevifilum, Strain UTEX LB 985" /LENGTH=135 /DNA_ID=CAMNT_0015958953 /DNA_START=123 /DNA_END=528 /DNA_ORIENTATION=+
MQPVPHERQAPGGPAVPGGARGYGLYLISQVGEVTDELIGVLMYLRDGLDAEGVGQVEEASPLNGAVPSLDELLVNGDGVERVDGVEREASGVFPPALGVLPSANLSQSESDDDDSDAVSLLDDGELRVWVWVWV